MRSTETSNMSTGRTYTQVSGGSNNPRWEPNKSNVAINPNNPPKIEGYYLNSNERNGKDGPFTVHEIQTVNPDGTLGESFDVSLGVGLNNMLGKVQLGKFVCVQFNGKKNNPKTGRNFNDTDVFVDENAIPYNQLKDGDVANTIQPHKQPANKTNVTAQKQTAPANFDSSDLPF